MERDAAITEFQSLIGTTEESKEQKKSRFTAKYGPFFQVKGYEDEDQFTDAINSDEEEQKMALEMNAQKINTF